MRRCRSLIASAKHSSASEMETPSLLMKLVGRYLQPLLGRLSTNTAPEHVGRIRETVGEHVSVIANAIRRAEGELPDRRGLACRLLVPVLLQVLLAIPGEANDPEPLPAWAHGQPSSLPARVDDVLNVDASPSQGGFGLAGLANWNTRDDG